MKKYLVLGLCLWGSCSVWASEALVSPIEKTPTTGTPTSEIDDMRSKPSLIINETNIDQAAELILSRRYQIGLPTQLIKNEQMMREIQEAIAAVCPPCEPVQDLPKYKGLKTMLTIPIAIGGAPNAPVYDAFCVTKGAELTINPDGCENIKTITEPGEYTCTAHFQNGVINPYPITLVSGSVIIPEEWPMERIGEVEENFNHWPIEWITPAVEKE